MPKSLSEEYPQVLTELADEACFDMSHEELLEHCHFVADSIAVLPQQAETVEFKESSHRSKGGFETD